MKILDTPLIYAEAMDSKGLTLTHSPSPELSPLALADHLAPLPEYKAAQTSDYDISGLLSSPLRLHEDLSSGCGGQTWPAGMVLAKHMLRYHRNDLHNARILELGAGGGLVGLAVASECPLQHQTPLLLTDQVEMFSLMKHNIALNNLQDRVKPMILNWGEPLPQDVVDMKPNVILAADCVYFEPAFPFLLDTLSALLALNADAVVYFCFKKRRRADMRFLGKIKKMFRVDEVVDEDRPIFSRESLFLFTIRSKKATQLH
ncbi:hypothetical protein ACRALDRAFT_1074753 [Sodiomyces alcalophilus JCM 7366]|uniref:uncharacterized protein n=1 Tax=Sodiomyces alcalophilus JCM 7366 TaxID=591952 RepID=UPI0039B3B923